ncbi:hypothetical protein [Sporosarcina sp. FSL K6-1508]|uniref:hypothetical protein n=1 Tax=Sporosarcina sp. FSL K6-1508 TaxID=2921553 RepID=UPI0030FAB020
MDDGGRGLVKNSLGLFERILGIAGSLASILGVSAFSVFAVINAFKENSQSIGIKILLSGFSVVAVIIFGVFVAMFLKFLLQAIFNSVTVDEEDDDYEKFAEVLFKIYIIVCIGTMLLALIGLLIIVWSSNIKL